MIFKDVKVLLILFGTQVVVWQPLVCWGHVSWTWQVNPGPVLTNCALAKPPSPGLCSGNTERWVSGTVALLSFPFALEAVYLKSISGRRNLFYKWWNMSRIMCSLDLTHRMLEGTHCPFQVQHVNFPFTYHPQSKQPSYPINTKDWESDERVKTSHLSSLQC